MPFYGEGLENYKVVFDEIVDTLLITDGTNGQIIDVSSSVTSLLGYDKHELIGEHFSIMFTQEEKDEISSLRDLNVFGSIVTERKLKAKDNSVVHVDMTINTLSENGKTYVLTSLRDISDKLKYEREIRRMNEELKVLNASKDKLFSIIAHDLKNPLMALMGFSDMMIEDSKTISPDEIEDLSTTINQLSKDTHSLLENLLTWARVQTESCRFERTKFLVAQEVDGLFTLLTHAADLKKISLINNVPDDLYLNADINMIITVIRNLISNAIKFSNENKKITVSAERKDNLTRINVSDEGIGIEPESIDNLFRIDVQTSTTGTKGEKGTGLGLILCNEFVNLHKGTISVRSELNKGTEFLIDIPD